MPLFSAHFLTALFLIVPALISAADSPLKKVTASEVTHSTTNGQRSFMRVTRSDPDTIALEIALRRFVAAKAPGPTIWLAGASHLGESNYYAGLQIFLDAQPVVLFEGIGAGSKKLRPESPDDGGIQNTLAKSLELAFQLNSIDYDRPHFRNSDLSLARLERLIAGDSPATDDKERGARNRSPAQPFDELLGIMDGSSMLGTLLHVAVKLVGSNPKLRAMTKLMLIETLGEWKGDMAQMKGAPPEIQKLLTVIIQERNKVVIEDLKKELASAVPAQSIAVFYGAGHMADFEKRLGSELAYRPAGEVWLRAISVHPRRAGVSESEMGTLRSLIQWQLQLMGEGDE